MVDVLNRQLLHALQVDGRAPFSSLATVLGVSDQTVARRYHQLRAAGHVRVRGHIDPVRAGKTQWIVHVRALPATAARIADALSQRTETSWVSLTTAGSDVLGVIDAPAELGHLAPWLTDMPATRGVSAVDASCVLHEFFGGPASLITKHGALTAEQIEALRPTAPVAPPACRPLDADDGPLLAALEHDGRTSVAALASLTGWSQSAVRRRIAGLVTAGLLYFDVDFAPVLLDLPVRAVIWLQVSPERLVAAGEALAGHPEVAYVAATTGTSNLYCAVLCPTAAALYSYLTGRVAALEGVQHVETATIGRSTKTSSPRGSAHLASS